MSFNIAVAGKGGTGKTSIASLIIRHLINNGSGPVLAIDADPNANLGESLGVGIQQTVGMILSEFQDDKMKIPSGMTKQNYLEYKLNGIIVEGRQVDLISMGRGEGPACYCYPNHVLKQFVDSLTANYAYMVMDNEAGMEHLSRRTTENINGLFLISDHSVKGVRTIARIQELVSELKLNVKRQMVVINFVPDKVDDRIAEEIERLGINNIITIPRDDDVYEYDLKQKSLLELPDRSPAASAVKDMLTKFLATEGVNTKGG